MVRETHSPNLDGPAAFRFPAKDWTSSQHLSPERVPSGYTASTSASAASKDSTTSEASPALSPHSSPTRRAKANLFADYEPNRHSPIKGGSLVLAGGIPQSPSLPEITALRAHGRTNSDVQGLVKRFEHLDVRDHHAESAERIKRREADLRRAMIAREEAESDSKRMRAENRRLERLLDEGADREQIAGRRIEILTGELAAAKEAHTSQSTIYEKELRKARKEAFKTSSAMVKLQEELKAARNGLRKAQQERDLEQQRAQQKEQERFETEYQLVPLQEELTKLERHLKAAQKETMALKASLKEEEVARIAAEGRIPLPLSQDEKDEFASPTKQSPTKRAASPLSDDKENIRAPPKKTAENPRTLEELEQERVRRAHAEELADFLQMECNFGCCGCVRASRMGHELSLSLDDALNEAMAKIREDMQSIFGPSVSADEVDVMDVELDSAKAGNDVEEQDFAVEAADNGPPKPAHTEAASAPDENERSMTFAAESPRPVSPDSQEVPATQPTPNTKETSQPASDSTTSVPLQPATPTHASQHHDTTPFRQHPSIRTVTTTTTIPMQFTPVAKPHLQPRTVEDAENIPPMPSDADAPPAFDRAAALAAIEYRRGRAKSLANGTATPRKQMMEGVGAGGRRDISAPALGQKSANAGAGAAGKALMSGTASVGRAQGRRMG